MPVYYCNWALFVGLCHAAGLHRACKRMMPKPRHDFCSDAASSSAVLAPRRRGPRVHAKVWACNARPVSNLAALLAQARC